MSLRHMQWALGACSLIARSSLLVLLQFFASTVRRGGTCEMLQVESVFARVGEQWLSTTC